MVTVFGIDRFECAEPERQGVDHVFEHVATRIIPVEPPVDVALGIERDCLCLALECRPVDMLGVAVGRDFAEPTPVRPVAEMVCLDQRDRAHRVGRGQLAHFLNPFPAVHLHADLDHTSRATVGVSHPPGVAGVESHRLFLVDVLACLDGGDEVKRVQVLRCCDQDCVDRLVVEDAR